MATTSVTNARAARLTTAPRYAGTGDPWFRFAVPGRPPLEAGERQAEVGDEVVGVLKADGHAHQAGRDARRLQLLGRQRDVRRVGGAADERLGAAERRG